MTVCCEVLEHLKNPNKGLSEIKRISKKDVIVSVPIEPVWRVLNILRGKYLKSFGNTPGHLNHWSVFSFQKLIRESGFCIKRKIISFPWQMYLIEGSEAQEVQGRLSPFLKNLRCKVASIVKYPIC